MMEGALIVTALTAIAGLMIALNATSKAYEIQRDYYRLRDQSIKIDDELGKLRTDVIRSFTDLLKKILTEEPKQD